MRVLEYAVFIIAFMGALAGCSIGFAASLEKAVMLAEHGLTVDAKRELINVIFEKRGKADDKSEAYYLLGNIAFEEDRIEVALNTWEELVKRYPKSHQANMVKDQLLELSEVVLKSAKDSLDNVVARSYLRHADFWSKDRDDVFTIDSSWIPLVEAAVKWYDKIIAEFPKSEASLVAYEEKLRTLFGWEDSITYQKSEFYGVKKNFWTYMPKVIKTFEDFERDHPDASTLQAFRFQIAQVYRRYRKWDLTRKWLNKIITEAGDTDSFYRDLAERRLKKVEHSVLTPLVK